MQKMGRGHFWSRTQMEFLPGHLLRLSGKRARLARRAAEQIAPEYGVTDLRIEGGLEPIQSDDPFEVASEALTNLTRINGGPPRALVYFDSVDLYTGKDCFVDDNNSGETNPLSCAVIIPSGLSRQEENWVMDQVRNQVEVVTGRKGVNVLCGNGGGPDPGAVVGSK